MSSLFRLLLPAVLVLAFLLPAAAVQPIGSAGWTADGWTNVTDTLYSGPGTEYAVTGTIDQGLRIRVDRCTQRWCLIHTRSVKGWVRQSNVSFGQTPERWLFGVKFPNMKGGGPICFFTGPNYTGTEFCPGPGHTYKDLVLIGYDNAFSSVKVGPSGTARVCRDRNFRSYCQVIDVDYKHLPELLSRAISSIQVY